MQVLLVVMAFASLLLMLPAVQTKLGKMATNYLHESFDTAIEVKKIDLSIFGNVQMKEVLIKDHHNDTLIYVEGLESTLYSLVNVFNNKMEFGTISLNNFILNIKTYEGEDDDGLSIFVDKFNEEKNDEPSGFMLSSEKLAVKNGYVEVYDENDNDNKPVFFKHIKGDGSNFKIVGPNVSVAVRDFSFVENHGIKAESFSSDFSYTKQSMTFLNTELETETSELFGDIYFNYKRENLADFNNKVNIDGTIKEAHLSLIDLKKYYNELGTKDIIHLTTNLKGQLNNLTLENLFLESDFGAVIEGDIHLKNSFSTENGFALDASLNELTSDYEQLKTLLPGILGNTLPSIFKDFGRFNIIGDTYVTNNLIDARVNINTDIGTAITDLELTNVKDIDNASYIGNIQIVDFNLGHVIKDTLIGKVSMNVDVDGEGFTLKRLNTALKGEISKYEFKDYSYSNISVDGWLKNQLFNGNMEVNDPNIKLNFNGLADFSLEVYKFDFKSAIDYCDLNTLNLFKRDSISNLNGELEINVNGNSLDDLAGVVKIKNSLYTNQKDQYFFKDFEITSSFQNELRKITINSSEIFKGEIIGNFRFNELGKLVQNSLGSIYSNYEPFEVTKNQKLNFRFEIYNKIVEVFFPDVTLSANTFISGNIDSDKDLFKLNVKSPRVIVYAGVIDSLSLQIDNKNPLFNTHLKVGRVRSKIYNVSDLHLVNKTLNDTLYFGTEFYGGKADTEKYNLLFYHTFNKENKSVLGVQKSNIVYKNNKWLINPENNFANKIVYDQAKKEFIFDPFLISSGNQEIYISGVIKDTISKDINFNFKNVDLAKITPKIDSLKLDGHINGSLNYVQEHSQTKPTVNLTVSDFHVNNSYQGDLKINIAGKNSIRNYAVDISMERNDATSFFVWGDIDFTNKQPTINAEVDFEGFKLDAFSPLGEDVFNKIRGHAYGNVKLTGLLANPSMEGELYLDEAGLFFPYLNVDYDFEGTSVIALKDQVFTFYDVSMKDTDYNSKGNLTGTLSHQYFDDWQLDLNIDTNNLLVLNTEEEETSLYYGTAFFEGIGTIKGPTDKLVIDVIGKTKKGTHFIMPISDVRTAETSQLILFVDDSEVINEEDYINEFISEKLKGMSLNFNIDVTKDAIVEMVVDKSSGSYLRGSGTGNLLLELDTKDKFNMYGDFVVDNGIYDFKYGGIINKPFTVKRGGLISWSGDPFTADINIEAIHRVSANPKSLLENINTSRKIPVDLITRFSGELFNSNREFDIEIPNSSSTVASELEFKLSNNKTTQFISLLVTGTFYNETDVGLNSNAVLYGTGVDLLSSAFDNILNDPNSKFKLKPVYTVGEKSNVEDVDTSDELAIAVDYQVNDRIIINGKVGVPIGADEKASVIGEVNVEFLMNESGSLRSSVFNRQNDIQYTEEEEGYTQGIGISYQIDFDNGRELLEKLSLKKKKTADTLNVIKAQDSIQTQKLVNFKNK